ncbi:MAG: AraC-like DNA-binding protein [Myxococcota bacterium]|jgi:AraC-like DNA-binding protein
MDDKHGTEHVKLERAGTRASVVSAVMLFGLSRGILLEAMLEATGTSLEALVDPEARLPDQVLGSAWRLIGERFPGQAIALEMATAAPMSVFGPLAQAARFSPTQRAMLSLFSRYDKVLSGGLHMSIIDSADTTALILDHQMDAVDGGHGAEAAVALGARLGRELLGIQGSMVRIEFAHSPNAPIAKYESWFAVPVQFGCDRNAMVFDAQQLEKKPAQTDTRMYQFIESHLALVEQGLLARIKDEPLDRVRAQLAMLAHCSDYSAESLAQRMGMSVRTLQRFTAKHGASLRSLIEEVREANARRLLSDERLSVDEVAFLLGYSDDRAFRRAFKRWTGATPAGFRAQA